MLWLRKFILLTRFSKCLQPFCWAHTDILDFHFLRCKRAMHFPIRQEAFLALQIVWLGKAPALGFGCRLCHLAGQCFQVTSTFAATQCPCFFSILWSQPMTPQVVSFTTALGRFIRGKVQRQVLSETKALALGRSEGEVTWMKLSGQDWTELWMQLPLLLWGWNKQWCQWPSHTACLSVICNPPQVTVTAHGLIFTFPSWF